jgi:hypothetical protein
MTDITKYRNVSLTHETYKTLISLSKVLLRWILKNDLKRTSVHTMPSASPCTATEEAVEYRGGVEPLPPCKYVHGKHGG